MTVLGGKKLQGKLAELGRAGPGQVVRVVDIILREAIDLGASDVHFEPTHRAVEVRFRIDGVLQPAATLDRELAPNLVARLKVLADLLTYRLDIPQEGRMREAIPRFGVDMRVSTFPTVHGEKAAVRLFDSEGRTLDLEQLGLSLELLDALQRMMRERTGAILLTGPSGSGKTTTIYACLRHLVALGGRHIVTIEDPVEQVIEGVSQSQARPGTEFDFARGLRSLLRQDPEVIMIGEIRDPETAGIAVEAALTGHLVFSTLHAGSACGVIGRLLEMGIEPYLLTSGLKGILNQRLVRRVCEVCRGRQPQRIEDGAWKMEDGAKQVTGNSPSSILHALPSGCPACSGTGYRGRFLLAELLTLDAPLRQAILAKADTVTLEATTNQTGRPTIWNAADQALTNGWTTRDEIERALGPR